ncbi:THUMP domain-containing protein [Planctomicrobium sp. SH661]|uniref:THUMP domain-containing class I SAM-dependent RNA methyltransferase n=1 Tax=Planctomicrobium sp. SH661 TaxID=3448124 RepID=UPI003F5B90AD
MAEFDLLVSAAFGMEAIVVRELRDLGYANAIVEDGRVRFRGDHAAICRANLWLRCAERVQVVVADFKAKDFDQLFDTVKELPWEEWLPADAKFPVTARCVRSEIRSVPNTQKMVKRAIVERLRKIYLRHWFSETGSEYNIEAAILGDRVVMTIDTTGDGLHKRGYRNLVGQAPLRETVAAALVKLSYWNPDRLLVDPFCGSGTIPIEAAMIGRNLAPGRNRSFIAENWEQIPHSTWSAARQEVKDLERRQPLNIPIIATDRDKYAIKMATQHARQAGVETDIHFDVKDFIAFPTNRDAGILICNPPYGERLGEEKEVRQLYSDMGELLRPLDDWSLYILTGAEGFERHFGKQADRRRKLYNARIACTYYQYLGPKPVGVEVIEELPAPAAREEFSPRAERERPAPREFSPYREDRPRPAERPAADNPWSRARAPKAEQQPAKPFVSEPSLPPPPVEQVEVPQEVPTGNDLPVETPPAVESHPVQAAPAAPVENPWIRPKREEPTLVDPEPAPVPEIVKVDVVSTPLQPVPAEVPSTPEKLPVETPPVVESRPVQAAPAVPVENPWIRPKKEEPTPVDPQPAPVPDAEAVATAPAVPVEESTPSESDVEVKEPDARGDDTRSSKPDHPWKKNPWKR